MKERMMGAAEAARTPDEPAPQTHVRSDAQWSPHEGLDPHQADLARIMLRLRAEVSQLSREDAVKRMGLPFGFESVALVPDPGPQRDGWSDRKMSEALHRDGDYMTMKGQADARMLDAIDRQVVHRLAGDPAMAPNFPERVYALRADVTGRVVDFMKDGPRLDERVLAESEMLERQSGSVIADRFRDSPIASFAPMPDRGEARRAWLEDALRAEHAAARQGLMTPTAIVQAAAARRGPVPQGWEPAPYVADRSRDVYAEAAVEAARIEKLSESSLRSRFRDVPGMVGAPIPDVAKSLERRTWVETAIVAQSIRQDMSGSHGHVRSKDVAITAEIVQSPSGRVHGVEAGRNAAVHSFAVAGMLGR